ncbi:MAG: hypothetical protein GY820_02030 [Gammaproteobacteria bacterium]|nr:hypothetical protein [Gammaproteobacteria bacterium]
MSYKIKSNVIRSVDGKVKYKQIKEKGRKHFHLGVWVDAFERELDEIEYVEYKLHPSFRKQTRKSSNRPNDFSVTFWTWGMFNIEVSIYFHSGEMKKIDCHLKYSLPDDHSEYVKV